MLILGLSGGQCLPQEVSPVLPTWQHDAAAVLIEDGRVVAGIEEERLNRVKHTNRAPLYAAAFCLDAHGVAGSDIDRVAFYWDAAQLDLAARVKFLQNSRQPALDDPRTALRDRLATHLGIDLPVSRFHFVRHHLAHAVSAFALSGHERSLVVTFDGQGERESGLVAIGDGTGRITPLASFPIKDSLGYLYQEAIMFLGYRIFDEYKVMGLAPYGDPARYRHAFKHLYTLHPDGRWELHRDKVLGLYEVMTPRRKGAEFTQAHKDFAAGIQEMLESIVLHLLGHLRRSTGERNLCLAGGVAHNCTMNGKILASGLFERVFVQPAAHDAGAALGAALQVYLETRAESGATPTAGGSRQTSVPPLEHLYWGGDVGSDAEIHRTLEGWRDFVSFERVDDICRRVAALMAEGSIVGWVQGRSEFGPRALGNRSIVADPRPAANKTLINAMVKKREVYRPFAPSVLVEDASDYFELPTGVSELPYMIVVVDVRGEKRALLGAVTHVDGSARVQTVSRQSNERFWQLIKAFKDITGVPVVLNTSFNNNAEPIVDTPEDAIVCFLTTGLHYLAIGDWLIRKLNVPLSACERLALSVPAHYRLTHTRALAEDWIARSTYQLLGSHDSSQTHDISEEMYSLLLAADGARTVGELCADRHRRRADCDRLLEELADLWSLRAVILRPAIAPSGTRPLSRCA